MTSIETQVLQPYKYGFITDIESDDVPAGLSEDVIRLISVGIMASMTNLERS